MSLETWKAEFYPVPADEVPAGEAVSHSLQKWRGLRAENLERHELSMDDDVVEIIDRDDWIMDITSETCALCAHHLCDGIDNCVSTTCPIVLATGHACDGTGTDGSIGPYLKFVTTANPEPMIAALEAAAKYEAEQKEKADVGE